MGEKTSFEDTLLKLEEIVEVLERGQLSLEESIRKFEEGVALAARCSELLQQSETKVKQLTKRAEGAFDLEDLAGPRGENHATGGGGDS